MSEAGFYFCGTDSDPDLARCYYCRRELDGWEPEDDPWEEHKRRKGQLCAFIEMGKKPQELSTEDMFNLEIHRGLKLLKTLGEKQESEMVYERDNARMKIDQIAGTGRQNKRQKRTARK